MGNEGEEENELIARLRSLAPLSFLPLEKPVYWRTNSTSPLETL